MSPDRMDQIKDLALVIISYSAVAFIVLVMVLALIITWMYWVDVRQTAHAVRRNYPVIGRFRYLFEHMGEFFRQYFFAQDREEMPFNRALRSWVYRAAKDLDSTIAFGSTRPLTTPGEMIFLNSLIPVQEQEAEACSTIEYGAGYAAIPFRSNKFFNISGMSYGALSANAITALANGAQQAGIWLNTGEGGLSDFHLAGGCDLVFQIGTAKYGVRDDHGQLSEAKLKLIAAREQVRMFEIKLSQGAKPGKGGMLPGAKVSAEIAKIRGIAAGVDSISPNGHPEIRSVSDLLQMIYHVRTVTGKPVGFKTVIGQSEWLDELCLAIHSMGLDYAPDFITIDSSDGGSGAAPQPLMDFVGLPAKRSLPLVVDKLVEHGLRERIKVIVSGKMITPSGVAGALCLGADTVVSGRGFLFALGCIQAMQCNKNTCPTGITTHNRKLQKGLNPKVKSHRVANYVKNMEHQVAMIAHSCGVVQARELTRKHAQMINERGFPIPLSESFPDLTPRAEFAEGCN